MYRRYKMTPADRDLLLDVQDGCYICGVRDAKVWHIDHDHNCCPGRDTCGMCIRGVACLRCNVTEGAVRELFSRGGHTALSKLIQVVTDNM